MIFYLDNLAQFCALRVGGLDVCRFCIWNLLLCHPLSRDGILDWAETLHERDVIFIRSIFKLLFSLRSPSAIKLSLALCDELLLLTTGRGVVTLTLEPEPGVLYHIQGDQLIMAVFFLYLLKYLVP